MPDGGVYSKNSQKVDLTDQDSFTLFRPFTRLYLKTKRAIQYWYRLIIRKFHANISS